MAQIEVVGNAGSDAELKFIKGAKGEFAVANLSLAEAPREYKNGEWIQGETVWWKVSATGELAESLADLPLKGVKLIVKGDIKEFKYTGRDGVEKQGFEIRAKTIAQVITAKRKATPTTTSTQEENAWPF
jgi:single-strand DNA-binding protein